MDYHQITKTSFSELMLLRSEVSILYESIHKKNALVLLPGAFLSCFEITYQFYQLVIYLINVHFGRKKNTGRTNSCILKITQNRYDNEMTNKIIVQIIFTIFTCCLNNLSEKRLNISTTQNKVVLKIEIVMASTPFVIL